MRGKIRKGKGLGTGLLRPAPESPGHRRALAAAAAGTGYRVDQVVHIGTGCRANIGSTGGTYWRKWLSRDRTTRNRGHGPWLSIGNHNSRRKVTRRCHHHGARAAGKRRQGLTIGSPWAGHSRTRGQHGHPRRRSVHGWRVSQLKVDLAKAYHH